MKRPLYNLFALFSRIIESLALCSLITIKIFTIKILFKMFDTSNYAESVKFVNTIYLSSSLLREWEVNAKVCQVSGVPCHKAQPSPFLEASHFIRVSRFELKCLFSVDSAIVALI